MFGRNDGKGTSSKQSQEIRGHNRLQRKTNQKKEKESPRGYYKSKNFVTNATASSFIKKTPKHLKLYFSLTQ